MTYAKNFMCIESEEEVLGGLILDPSAYSRVAESLREELFTIAKHKQIYRAIASVIEQGLPSNLLEVSTWLENEGQLDDIGGSGALGRLVNRVVSAVNIDRHVKLLWDKFQYRKADAFGNEMKAKAQEVGHGSPRDLWNWIREKVDIFQKEQAVLEEKKKFVDRTDHAIDRLNGMETCQSGFLNLDNVMSGGFEPGSLTVIGALTSIGKTAMMLNTARKIAETGKPVVFFSMEMTNDQLVYRLWSQFSCDPKYKQQGIRPLEADRVRRHRSGEHFVEEEFANIINIAEATLELPIYLYDDVFDLDTMRAKLLAIQEEHGEIGAVFVDYLQIFEGGHDASQRSAVLGKIAHALRKMGQDFRCPIFAGSQVKTSVADRHDKRPGKSDLANSSEISHAATNVITLHRDDAYDSNSPNHNILEVIVCKSRNGKLGTAKLYFDRRFGFISDLCRRFEVVA